MKLMQLIICLNLKKETGKSGNNDGRDVETVAKSKYLSNLWRTFEMLLINCGINLILAWCTKFLILPSNNLNQAATFTITNAHLYVSVVTLSTEDNAKLLQQLKCFKIC